MLLGGLDIGIDLGTATVLVYVRGRGIVINEPSVVALDTTTKSVLAVGHEARKMIGRTPGNIVAIRPLKDGVIADYDVTEMMLKYFLNRICGRRRFFRPRVVACVPSGVTSVEKRAVLEAMMDAGAKQTFIMEEPMAAAIGAGLNVTEPSGHMIIDIGGGTTDIAVISLGGLVVAEALRVAGDKFDQAIVRYVRKQYGLAIGDPTAEQIKVEIGSAYPLSEKLTMNVRGRDLVTGLPRTIEMTSDDAHEALMEPVSAIVDGLRSVLERTPPELAADIVDKGIVMTGGGSLLRGLDHLLTVQTGIPVYCADDPVACVAKGTGRFLEGMVGARMDQLLSKSIS
ncbi:MAG: rod shape-determining protein [Firmicutes bacterium]|nr:rod shape-determining protein [Bacillota bacterium]